MLVGGNTNTNHSCGGKCPAVDVSPERNVEVLRNVEVFIDGQNLMCREAGRISLFRYITTDADVLILPSHI